LPILLRHAYLHYCTRCIVNLLGQANTVENARQDLASALAELEDFALENTSLFFNSVDKKEMEKLMAETGYKENKEEGRKLFVAVKSYATDFDIIAVGVAKSK